LGISDDIRPKTYRPISKKVVKAEIKVAQKKIEEKDDGQIFNQSHTGDFFDNTPIGNNGQNKRDSLSKKVEGKKNHRWVYTLIIILAVGTLIGLVVWQNYSTLKSYVDGSYKKKNSQNLTDIINTSNDSVKNYNSTSQPATNSTGTSTAQPAATAAPAIDKSTVSISVLNGSGVKNSATAAANTLKTAGFNVKSTGNAKTFNYSKTYIYYKTDDATAANLVKEALASRITEVVKNTSVVGAAYDIVVVVGKQ